VTASKAPGQNKVDRQALLNKGQVAMGSSVAGASQVQLTIQCFSGQGVEAERGARIKGKGSRKRQDLTGRDRTRQDGLHHSPYFTRPSREGKGDSTYGGAFSSRDLLHSKHT
jgi:hypothetical protein